MYLLLARPSKKQKIVFLHLLPTLVQRPITLFFIGKSNLVYLINQSDSTTEVVLSKDPSSVSHKTAACSSRHPYREEGPQYQDLVEFHVLKVF